MWPCCGPGGRWVDSGSSTGFPGSAFGRERANRLPSRRRPGGVFRVWIDDQEIYLPKSVGDSLLKSHQKGNDVFTILRTEDVYEIKPVMEAR